MTDRIIIRYIGQSTDFGRIYMKTPKALMHEEMFSVLDNHDKIAYSFMLDRAALSAKNGWVDSNGHVYIYFTVEEACRILRLGRTKVAKIFKVLTQVGLIERVPQGLGRPVIIYVKDIVVNEPEKEHDTGTCDNQNVDNSAIREESDISEDHIRPFGECQDDRNMISSQLLCECPDDRETVVCMKTAEINRRPLSERPDDCETVTNKTDKNNTEYNNIIYINPIRSSRSEKDKKEDGPIDIDIDDKKHLREFIRHLIHNHIDYSSFEDSRHDDLPLVDDMVDIMTDVIMTDDKEIVISRIPRNGDMVRKHFMLIKSDVISCVIDSVRRVRTRIRNMRQYLLTSLYNACNTARYYYNA